MNFVFEIIILLILLVIILASVFVFKKNNDKFLKESIDTFKRKSDEDSAELTKNMQLKFENIANNILNENNKILNENNKKLSENNLKDIELTLKPFKEKFDKLGKDIEENRIDIGKQKESFKNQVENIIKATEGIQQDANNLSKALKGDSKTQGLWGEQILARTLEQSGLTEGRDYKLQESYEDETGRRKVPDAVIYLPGERNIVIDSKVSLRSYEQFINEENDQEKAKYLKKHISDMRDRIIELKQKDYSSLLEINSPDYVLIFIPIESAYSVAVTNDWEFQKLSSESKIAFTTPTTLMAILRMAENLWRLDKQNKNADLIASRAGLLIDKFGGFLDDIENLGKNIKKSDEIYHDALKKLIKGKGNIFMQIKDLEELGAKNKRTLKISKDYSIEDIDD